jgi:hypothetical protein
MKYPKPKRYFPIHPEKYAGDVNGIICRSNLERHFFKSFDRNENVIAWGSEEIHIPYFYPVDQSWHRYFPDNILKIKGQDGSIYKILIEIKPRVFCSPPPKPKRITKGYINTVNDYIRNRSKWEAADKWCKQNGFIFKILTEQDLKKSI